MDEMLTQMPDYVDDFAEHRRTTREMAIAQLKHQYDGYHFTWPSPGIFNPYSLLNAFQDHQFANYWFASGTPTYLIEMLRIFETIARIRHAQHSNCQQYCPQHSETPYQRWLVKLDKRAQAAINQIDLKDYKSKFALCGLPIVKVGVNFDSEKRTISDWKIE